MMDVMNLFVESDGTGFVLEVLYRSRLPFLTVTASITVVFSLFTFVVPTVTNVMSKSPTPPAARLSKETTTFGVVIAFPAHLAIHS